MKGEVRILNTSGHATMLWDGEVKKGDLDPAYVEAEFDRLISEGHFAVGTTEAGESVQLKEFDQSYPTITLSPQFVGG